jgi:outer membrane protein assembly factor BamB
VAVLLTPSPERRFKFEAAATGGPAVGAGCLGVGLRGGKIALSDALAAQRLSLLLNLPGLSELSGSVAFSTSRVVFATNEGHLACHNLSDGERLWLVQMPAPTSAEHPPLVQDGRVFVAYANGSITCLSLETGRQLWNRNLDGPISGSPTLINRTLRVATKIGTLYRLDANDGRSDPKGLLRFDNGISTGIAWVEGLLVLGTGDGRLFAVHDGSGRIKWELPLGRAARVDELAVGPDGTVFVAGDQNAVLRVSVRTGTVERRTELAGERRTGLLLADRRVFTVVSRRLTTTQNEEVLVALSGDSFETLWEYRDEKGFVGAPASDGSAVFVTASSGEVLRFK